MLCRPRRAQPSHRGLVNRRSHPRRAGRRRPQTATWRRNPAPDSIVHSDRSSQFTSWIFGHRLREAGLLGSMGRVALSVDNSMMESFWSTMQRELLDRQRWTTKAELGSATFEWIEAFYNPARRHTPIGDR